MLSKEQYKHHTRNLDGSNPNAMVAGASLKEIGQHDTAQRKRISELEKELEKHVPVGGAANGINMAQIKDDREQLEYLIGHVKSLEDGIRALECGGKRETHGGFVDCNECDICKLKEVVDG